ncbi:hypothetical protein [Maledivibacter halophilus]|uniref:hypothetical protein n=1 Tax=Maledivibacter halophilus TaxID=36842 RepID=UPI0009A61E15|nr:hypothetical protein [Maledivibacter halophilus]
MSQKHLESPDVFAPPSFTSEIFHGEFHWQPYFERLDITKNKNMWKKEGRSFDIHIPTYEYSWE